MRTVIVGVVAALLGMGSTALAQECHPSYACEINTTRIVHASPGDGSGANTLNFATTLVSSAFSLALSNSGKNGKQAERPWGWTAFSIGFLGSASAIVTLSRPGAQPLLGMASITSGALAMMAGGRNLLGSWGAPPERSSSGSDRLSVAPIVAPAARSAGVSVSLRF